LKIHCQIVLWTVAFQGVLALSLSPQADCVPIHLFAFALAPCLGVLVSTIRKFSFLCVVKLFIVTYILALLVRIAGVFTPWWNYDPGLLAGIIFVPAPITVLIRVNERKQKKFDV
jgi:hypothetical protein